MMHKNIAIVFAALFLLGSCDKKTKKSKNLKEKPKRMSSLLLLK
jgi:HlyD family secretion protein